MYGFLKRVLLATFVVGGLSSVALAEEEAVPIFYPISALAIQYETKNCGFETVMISTQLEYYDPAKTERLGAFMPKILSEVYAELKKYLNKKKAMKDNEVKEIMLTTINKVIGQGSIKEVLIMNVVHG